MAFTSSHSRNERNGTREVNQAIAIHSQHPWVNKQVIFIYLLERFNDEHDGLCPSASLDDVLIVFRHGAQVALARSGFMHI